jgi:hypothetical protein
MWKSAARLSMLTFSPPTSLCAHDSDLERRHRAELERIEIFKQLIAEFAPIFDRIPPRAKSPDPEAGR